MIEAREERWRAAKANERMRMRSGAVSCQSRLVAFLYTLARDEMPTGRLEAIEAEREDVTTFHFTNGWLARWAMDLAERIVPGHDPWGANLRELDRLRTFETAHAVAVTLRAFGVRA